MQERSLPPLKAVRLGDGRLLVPRREASAGMDDWPGMVIAEPGSPDYARWEGNVYGEGEQLPMFVRWALDDLDGWPNMRIIERRDGPTPAGGVYSEAYTDLDGRVTEIVEYDAAGDAIARTYASSKEEL